MSLNMSGRATTNLPTRTAGQWLSLIAGAAFVLIGLAGFFVTGFSGWTEHDQEQTLLGLSLNPLHNVVHLALGALGLVMWRRAVLARWYGVVLFVGYTGALVLGLTTRNEPHNDVLNLNQPDDVLHGLLAVLGLIIAFVPVRTERRPSTAELR
ncbi:DUF4383 domain-containing protein [Kineococcus glutinatus]|uniref:DUF4383 domain-containing protein n=1 Tax=Kineococcus glutinatus TaxID=1070872 RepID=A0ABP9H8C5_9ACTN